MKVPVSMFDNGLHAGVAEQQKLGTEECDTVYQRISHVGQVVGVRIPDNPAQPPTIIPQVARYNQQARPLSFSGTSIQVGHKECTPTNWPLTAREFSLKAQPTLKSSSCQ